MKTETTNMKLLQKLQTLLLLMVLVGFHKVRSDLVVEVHAGSTATLTCPNEKGKEFVMSTWKVGRLNKTLCYLSFLNSTNEMFNDCNNHTRLDIGPKTVALTLENITISDEGSYICEVANEKGAPSSAITLKVLVMPSVFISLASSRSAKCQAIGGHPAATIWWNSTLLSEVNDSTFKENNKTTTVISTYTPKEDNETNATCTVHHPAFPNPVVLNITIPSAAAIKKIWWVSIPAAVIIVIAVTILLLCLRKYLANKNGSTSELQENPSVIVEEVEPYASFTQKVNTIYNSTNELSEEKEKNPATNYGINKIYF